MAIQYYANQDVKGTLTVAGASTFNGAVTIIDDSGLFLKTLTNGVSAQIKFSDNTADYSQIGHIKYYHANGSSYGSNESFVIGGTETSMTILADGKLMYNLGIYSKPATGTGAGTRKDTLWDSAYTVTNAFTTIGTNFTKILDVTVPTYMRINADETLSPLNAAQFLAAIGGAAASDLGDYLPLVGGTLTGDLIMDANSGSSPDIFFYNVSDNYARMLFDTSNQFLIKIGTTNEMTMSATATTFDSSITAKSAVLSGPSDSMLTLNQTGTDTGWSYINFQTSNVRNYYVGQDSSKNFNIYNDVIDVLGFSMSYTDANITLGADLISGGSITIGSGGGYNAGSIFSDANWGMIFRALQDSPNNSDFLFSNSDDVERLRITSTEALFANDVKSSGNLIINTGSHIFFDGGNSGTYISEDVADRLRIFVGGLEFMRLTEAAADTIGIFRDTTFSGTTSGIAPTADLNFATKKYVDDSITGGANYLGTWNPDDSLNSGYGDPSLEASGRTDDSGDYFICSADGAAHPNGGTSEPDSWNTGDWVIWNEDLGTGGLWQKLDNTTVLSGAGTTNSVAKFTDSETIGDGPITFSSNDSTFAGNITAVRGFFDAGSTNVVATFTSSDATSTLQCVDGTGNVEFGASGNSFVVQPAGGAAKFTLDTNYGYFTTLGGIQLQSDSSVFVAGSSATNGARMTHNGTDAYFLTASGDLRIYNNAQDKDIIFRGNDGGSSTVALTLDMSDSGWALFNAGINLGTISNATSDTDKFLVSDGGEVKYRTGAQVLSDIGGAAASLYLPLAGGTMDASANINMNSGTLSSVDSIDFGIGQLNGVSTSNLILKSLGDITYNVDSNNNGNSSHIFQESGSELMRIRYDGNVGIGTDDPVKKLQVSDSATGLMTNLLLTNTHDTNGDTAGIAFSMTDNDLYNKAGIVFERTTTQGRGKLYICNNNTNDSSNFTLANAAITIKPNRNVGIGADDALGKLMVRDDTAGAPTRLIVSNGGTAQAGTTARLSFYEGTDEKGYIERRRDGSGEIAFVTPADDNPFVWENPSGEIMRINNGNVGIGTTSPDALLEISGNAGADPGPITNPTTFRITDAGNAATGAGDIVNPWGKIEFYSEDVSSTGPSVQAQIASVYNTIYSNSSDLHFYTRANPAVPLSTRMTIEGAGNVGIGTTNPENKLHVQQSALYTGIQSTAGIRIKSDGASAIGNYHGTIALSRGTGSVAISAVQEDTDSDVMGMAFFTHPSATGGDAAVEKMRIDQNGNVGIGTNSPDDMLEVYGSSPNIRVTNTAETDAGIVFNDAQAGTGQMAAIKFNSSDEKLKFFVNDETSQRMVIDTAGNVGIGNTGPNHKLDVTGDIYSSNQMLTKGAAMACFTVLGDLDTGLGNFDTSGGVSLVSNNKPVITIKDDRVEFDGYTATAVTTTGSLSATQGQQALTEDTLANLCVDPDGNVVRGSQEGTWTFTKAQLDALATTTSGGTQLISAPGANKAVIVEESNWMIKYSGTGSMSQNGFEIRQSTVVLADAGISRIPSGKINEIMNSAQGTPTNPSYGFYARDLPQYNNDARTYKTNAQTVLMRINTNATPANLVSISIKLKYRLFDATTF